MSESAPLPPTARREPAKVRPSASSHDDDDDSAAVASAGAANGGISRSSPLDFVEWGPPPDMAQRELLFDSLNKIVGTQPQKDKGYGGKSQHSSSNAAAAAQKGTDSRGTYVFTWGAGYHGQLGRKFVRGQKKYSAIPMLVEMAPGAVIRQVTCGGLHTAVVTEEGKVYTWGDGRKGELGHVHDPSLKQTPRQVEMLDHVFITSIACGGSHTVAISDSGFLYSWGWARHGQCGHNERSNQKFPKKIDHPLVREVVQVACGKKHTMCITKAGAALAFGANRHGQCGLGDFDDRLEAEPVRLPAMEASMVPGAPAVPMAMVAVSCGAIHSALVSKTGAVYIAGFGEHFMPAEHTGATGSAASAQHFFPEPKRIDLPEPIRSISCGQAHNIALSVSNNVYTFGAGEYGQLGFGVKGNSATPRLVLDTQNVRAVSAGRYHSFALTDAGILYSWGCGENGQLGLNSDENILLPTVVTPILGTVVGQVSCGEHHTAILTSAPWTKLAQDVHEWLHAAKVEHELRELYLRKTRRGLTSKDLAKLAVEKEKWRVGNEARKAELEAEEQAYMTAEVDSVQFEAALQKEVRQALTTADTRSSKQGLSGANSQTHLHTASMKRINLPAVHDAQNGGKAGAAAAAAAAAAEDEDEEKTAARDSRAVLTRLPTLNKKGTHSGSQTERAHQSGNVMAQTAPLDGSMTVRASSSYDATARAAALPNSMVGTGVMPTSRTAFLKETAGMIRRMTHVVHDSGEAQSQRELQEALTHVHGLRKEYDALVNDTRRLSKRAADLRRESELMQSGSSSAANSVESLSARLSTLQMQLSTVTIKLAETSENRRNYELNIAHLKEEDFDHFQQLKLLRKQHADTNLYVKKMQELRVAAHAERSKAEGELAAFRNEVGVYQRFVGEQLTQFQHILAIVRAQNAKRAQAKAERDEKHSLAVTQRVSLLHGETASAEKESAALALRLQSLELKLRHFEDSFQKISACTGLNHPDAIISKFSFKSEIRAQLQSDIDEKQHILAALGRDEASLRAELESIKLGTKEQTWRDVEQLSENAREVSTRSSKAQKEIERVTQRLAFVQEGLMELLATASAESVQGSEGPAAGLSAAVPRLLEEEKSSSSSRDVGDEGASVVVPGLWSAAHSAHVLQHLDLAVDGLLTSLAREEEQRRALEGTSRARQQQQGPTEGTTDKTKLFGFNLRHLRMLSQQNQLVEQQLQQQQQLPTLSPTAEADGAA